MDIPRTKEYGWSVLESGELTYTPSKKSFWNRVRYAVEKEGGKLLEFSTGFEIQGIGLSTELREFISSEMSASGIFVQATSGEVKRSKEGREEPDLDS